MGKIRKRQEKDAGLMKVRFSIGAKLISIITIIVLVSVSITALISRLMWQDLQIAAEKNNVEINRRLAMETESALANVRSNSRMLIRIIAGDAAHQNAAQNAIVFFFEENPQIAVIFFTTVANTNEIVVNRNFFHSKEIDEAMADSFRNDCLTPLMRAAAGETILLNPTPHFTVPVLALFFPWHNGGAGVLFSSTELDNTFCFGANQSYLLNDSGDILIHADFELIRDGVNVADSDFTRYVWDSQARNSQALYTSEDGIRYFGAFTKLNTGGCTVITGIEYDKVLAGMATATRRNIYLSAAVLLISIMFAWFFAKSISGSRNKGEQE
jgi:adenylate cyclase